MSARAATTPDTTGLLKMRDLAEQSGVSAGTIKHYLREGVLGDDAGIVRTSRNMAWYPPDFVERVRLVKRLQEERFMPLRLIKGVMDRGPEQAAALVEVEDRIVERALEAQPGERLSKAAGARALRRPAERARPARRDRACSRPTAAATTATTC